MKANLSPIVPSRLTPALRPIHAFLAAKTAGGAVLMVAAVGGAGVGELAVGGIVTCISGTQRSLKLLTGRFIRVDRGKTTSANHLATMVQAGAHGSFEEPTI